jgi:hypothetical protein
MNKLILAQIIKLTTRAIITFVIVPERVLGPVLEALVPMKVDIQQNVSRIIIKTFCEAWLEHIRIRRIKFR